jgi:hypothetical protein
MIFYRLILFLCLALFSFLPTHAEAHSPYFVDYSDWITEGQEEYRLQGLYGDGIFFADPVRVVLRNRNGGVSAATATGLQASGYCPSLDFCWGFTFGLSGVFPTLWRLLPSEMERTPANQEDESFGYPEIGKDLPQGFTISYNYFMLPVAWAVTLPHLLTHASILALPVFAAFLIFWYGAQFVKKRRPASRAAKAFKYLTVAVLMLLAMGAIGLIILVLLMHGAGLLVTLLFLTWIGIDKIWVVMKKRMPE